MLLCSPTTFSWKRSEETPVICASVLAVPKASSTADRPVSNTPLRARMWIRMAIMVPTLAILPIQRSSPQAYSARPDPPLQHARMRRRVDRGLPPGHRSQHPSDPDSARRCRSHPTGGRCLQTTSEDDQEGHVGGVSYTIVRRDFLKCALRGGCIESRRERDIPRLVQRIRAARLSARYPA